MSSIVSVSEHSSLKQIGFGLAIFVSGGLASYAFFQYWSSHQQPRSQGNSRELNQQINELKREIVVLKGTLTDAVSSLRKELDAIRGVVSSKRSRGKSNKVYSGASVTTSSSYQSALSDNDTDDEFMMPPDGIGDEEKKINLDDLDAMFAKSDLLSLGSDEEKEEAMRILQDNEISHQDSWQLLWRLSRSHVGAATMRSAYDERSCHATSALEYARRAVQLKEDSSEAHKWYAISLGTMADFVGTKEKIEYGYEVKEHCDRALELNPTDPTLHFMVGRWCWEIYKLSWIERKLAATLFATPPSANIEDAIEAFLKAEEIQPNFYKANQHYLAKCYYEINEKSTAKQWLESAKLIPAVNKDDRDTQKEIENMLSKL